MAVNSLSDLATTFSISKNEYENLIRESKTLEIISEYIKHTKEIDREVLVRILGIREICENKENVEEKQNDTSIKN